MILIKNATLIVTVIASLALTAIAQDAGLDMQLIPSHTDASGVATAMVGDKLTMRVLHRHRKLGSASLVIGLTTLRSSHLNPGDAVVLYQGLVAADLPFDLHTDLTMDDVGVYVLQAFIQYADGSAHVSQALILQIRVRTKLVVIEDPKIMSIAGETLSVQDRSIRREANQDSRGAIDRSLVADRLARRGLNPGLHDSVIPGSGRFDLNMETQQLQHDGGPATNAQFQVHREAPNQSDGQSVPHPAGNGDVGRYSQEALTRHTSTMRNLIPGPALVGVQSASANPRGMPSPPRSGADSRMASDGQDEFDMEREKFRQHGTPYVGWTEAQFAEEVERQKREGTPYEDMSEEQINDEVRKQQREGTKYEGWTDAEINAEAKRLIKEKKAREAAAAKKKAEEKGTKAAAKKSSSSSTVSPARPKTASPPPTAITPDPDRGGPDTMAGKKFREEIKGLAGVARRPMKVSPMKSLIDPGPDGNASSYRPSRRVDLRKALNSALDPLIYKDDTGTSFGVSPYKKSPKDTLVDPPTPDSASGGVSPSGQTSTSGGDDSN